MVSFPHYSTVQSNCFTVMVHWSLSLLGKQQESSLLKASFHIFKRYHIIWTGFVMLAQVAVYNILLYYRLHSLNQLRETGSRFWILPPAFNHQFKSVISYKQMKPINILNGACCVNFTASDNLFQRINRCIQIIKNSSLIESVQYSDQNR